MRLTRGTLFLILAALVVIAAGLFVANQQASTPTATPTPTSVAAGPLFPTIADVTAQAGIVRFEVVDNEGGQKTVMTKDEAGVWTVVAEETTNLQELATDQTEAVGTMSNLASLAASDRFETDDLAQFGLDTPRYTLTLTDREGAVYRVQVGDKAAANPRYYALVGDDTRTVYVVQQTIIDGLVGSIAQPAYVPPPTPTATFTATPNPFSEVEQTQTAEAALATLFADLTATAQAGTPTIAATETSVPAQAAASATPTSVPATATTAPATATTVPASATPRPTNTPRPPSATPVPPSATPRPTNTQPPTPTQEVLATATPS